MFDILLKDALIIDPSQGIHKESSIAIAEEKIAAIGTNLPGDGAIKVYDMKGKIITPGLIDIHCHPAKGFLPGGSVPDEIGVNTGVTTLCDAGSAGAANFGLFRQLILQKTITDVFCFLNLANFGLVMIKWDSEIWDEHDINVEFSKKVIEGNRDTIKGIKIRIVPSLVGGMGVKAVEIAKRLSSEVKLPLMMHIGNHERSPQDGLDDLSRTAVSLMEKGDILSHYLTWESGGLILRNGTIYPELESAQRRGVILDACTGLSHFSFSNARHAFANGLIPTVISTDMCEPALPAAQSMAVTMSKFLDLGLSIDQIIAMTTINPAKAIAEDDRRGGLRENMPADITVMELKKGNFIFGDGRGGEILHSEHLLEPIITIKAGKLFPAYSGYHMPPVFNQV